ncbi:MAG: ABC transporter permease subunit [Chitinophagales bacterium]
MMLTTYVFKDIIRNKTLIAYTVLLAAISFGLFSFDANPEKAVLGLLNILLLVVPLVSIIYSSIYYYNSLEFIELVLAQPVARKKLFFGLYFGSGLALSLAFLIGCALPILLFARDMTGFTLIISGILITWVFNSLAFLAAVISRDKARGIGMSLLFWFYFTFIYDALVLMILFSFSDYPIERGILTLTFLNPIDLIRIILLMQLDASALMSFTGAVFSTFLSSGKGLTFCILALILWSVLPALLAVRTFVRKDI